MFGLLIIIIIIFFFRDKISGFYIFVVVDPALYRNY
jgi:hypothetical protein